jgi:hypothetical protein
MSDVSPLAVNAEALTAPKTCAAVTFDMGDGSYEANVGWWEGGGKGALLWNPKGGYGHVLDHQEPCGGLRDCGCGGWFGACSSSVWMCECGEDDAHRDHHYALLRKAPS